MSAIPARARESQPAWVAPALTPAPTPTGLTSRDLVRRAIAYTRPPRLPYALVNPVRGDFFELAPLERALDAPARRTPGTAYDDAWGVRREATRHLSDRVLAHPLADDEPPDAVRYPDAGALTRTARVASFVRRAAAVGKYVVAADPVLLYERLEAWLGFPALLTAPRRDPGRLAVLVDRLADLTVAAMKHYADLGGIDAFMTWQDLASQAGPHFRPAVFRRCFQPAYARIVAAAHAAGLHVIWHLCGQARDLIPDLVDCGVDVVQLDRPQLVGHALLAERFGGRVCFWNTFDTAWAAAGPRTAADLRAEAAAMVDPFRPLGGGMMLRQDPLPEASGLTRRFQTASARAILAAAGAAPERSRA